MKQANKFVLQALLQLNSVVVGWQDDKLLGFLMTWR